MTDARKKTEESLSTANGFDAIVVDWRAPKAELVARRFTSSPERERSSIVAGDFCKGAQVDVGTDGSSGTKPT